MIIRHVFRRIAHATAEAIGSPYAFIAAVSAILIWAACGPLAHYSDTWQLIINTSTTIVTFLVVFMIQNSQNRDSKAVHLKLDELICAVKAARNRLVDVEDLDDEEIARLTAEFHRRRTEPDAARRGREVDGPPPHRKAKADAPRAARDGAEQVEDENDAPSERDAATQH